MMGFFIWLLPAGGHDLTNNEVTPGRKKAAILCDPQAFWGGGSGLSLLWPWGFLVL